MNTCKPTEKQLAFLDWEFGVFFHFGIRTFYEGHRDWDMQEMPLEGFCPSALDCENWISTIAKAGARYAVLVCKHHDGFANWPSKYTDYSVANTPWKDGKGDVVREYVDACRKYGLKVGLYYSPAEFGSKNQDAKDYDTYFINQISELLTGYGKIDYLWFDGCGSEGHTYDTERIIGEIRRMQPEILIFNMWDHDTRWVGNECGVAGLDNRNVVNSLPFSVLQEEEDALGEDVFLPAECDCTMRMANWFYSDADEDTVKSVEELMGLYELSVGSGANLLINIGPDRRGLLPDKDAANLLAFGEEIRRRYTQPLGTLDGCTCRFDKPTLVNQLVLMEDLHEGESILEFEIWAQTTKQGTEVLLHKGLAVGHKRICKFPAICAQQLTVKITKAEGTPAHCGGYAYYVK